MRRFRGLLSLERVATRELAAALLAVSVVAGCNPGSQQTWPWWSSRDSSAVRAELSAWRQSLAAWPMLGDTMRLALSGRPVYTDSTSSTGDSLYKFGRVLRAWFEPTDSVHIDVFQFGVTADTVEMRDTFCEVAYRDSMAACRLLIEYDSVWVIGYRPDTIIDTARAVPETTIVFRANYTSLRGFAEPQIAQKTYSWSGFRKLFMRRVTDSSYVLKKLTGFRVATPTAEDAPAVTRVVLSRPGRQDTVFYAPRKDGRGLYNLRPLDSLYSVRPGEVVGIEVQTSGPADTNSSKNCFFVTSSGRRADITASARLGRGSLSFATAGYEHIYVEVVPTLAVLYPNRGYSSTVWAIPVMVRE